MFVKYLKGEPSPHVIRYRNGRIVDHRDGANFWYVPLNTSVAAVPIVSRKAQFLFTETTANSHKQSELNTEVELESRRKDLVDTQASNNLTLAEAEAKATSSSSIPIRRLGALCDPDRGRRRGPELERHHRLHGRELQRMASVRLSQRGRRRRAARRASRCAAARRQARLGRGAPGLRCARAVPEQRDGDVDRLRRDHARCAAARRLAHGQQRRDLQRRHRGRLARLQPRSRREVGVASEKARIVTAVT